LLYSSHVFYDKSTYRQVCLKRDKSKVKIYLQHEKVPFNIEGDFWRTGHFLYYFK